MRHKRIAYNVHILPFVTQIKHRNPLPPPANHTLKAEVIFCVRGVRSPLLSNILLDDLDKELERRGHSFCRYADDCNVYVRSWRAGERVMASITRFLTERLRLTVNGAKSAVDRPWNRSFLGYTVTNHMRPRLRVAARSVDRLRDKLRSAFCKGRGRSIAYSVDNLAPILRGWINYFRLAQVTGPFEELDRWVRRKLRCILWRQWKQPRTRAKTLTRRGLEEARAWQAAYTGRGPWWNAGASHMHDAYRKAHFDKLGLLSLLDQHRRLNHAS